MECFKKTLSKDARDLQLVIGFTAAFLAVKAQNTGLPFCAPWSEAAISHNP